MSEIKSIIERSHSKLGNCSGEEFNSWKEIYVSLVDKILEADKNILKLSEEQGLDTSEAKASIKKGMEAKEYLETLKYGG